MVHVFGQASSGLRFEWGLAGAGALSNADGCVVVVDVLSFTSTVSIAVSRGTAVLPYRWRDRTAEAFAAQHDAVLAVGRSEMTAAHPWSLSGASLLRAPATPRLVLPSPNGSTIAASVNGAVVAASLRNGNAVAAWLYGAGYGTVEKPIAVIAAGEQWSVSNMLRPALEDLLGAGKVLSALMAFGLEASVESQAAASTYEATHDVKATLFACVSGQELIADGYAPDVEVACAEDVDAVVPLLQSGRFTDASDSE